MKNILFLILLGIAGAASAQTYEFVYGDLHFMTPNTAAPVSGMPEDKFVLRTDLPDATFVIYYDEKQTLVCQKGFMKGGHRVKSWAYYYPNQKTHWEMVYNDDGEITGTLREYYADGSTKSETEYRKGVPSGMSISYNDKGKRTYQCSYVDGKLDGKAITYNPDGTLAKTEVYSKGTQVSVTLHSTIPVK